MTDDLYLRAQQAAEEHLERCWAVLDREEEPDQPVTLAEFCGCLRCQVRETLYAALPSLRAAWEEETR